MRRLFLFLVLGILLVQSCTIQKRRYMKGWHVSTKKITKKSNASKNNQKENLLIIDTPETLDSEDKPTEIQEVKAEGIVSVEESIDENLSSDGIHEEQNTSQKKGSKGGSSKPILHQGYQTKKDVIVVEKKEPWVPKMWGGILGVLLGLIAVPFLFLIIFFLFSADYDDTFEFQESSDDTPFKRSFKRSYNSVLRVGVCILLILTFIAAAVFFIAFLYAEFGILGAILGVLATVLIIVLLAYLFGKFFELILPG